jgi:glucokinase
MNPSFRFANTISSKEQLVINKSIILNYLRNNLYSSRAKITSNIGISAPTTSKIVDELISEGYVVELGKDHSAAGKKAIKIGFNVNKGNVIGVDLGKDKIRLVRSNFGGKFLKKHVGFEIYFKDKNLLDKVIKEILMFIEITEAERVKNNGQENNLQGICIGIPADVDSDSGKIISTPLFDGWQDLNLRDIFKKYFNTKIFVENSKNMAAIGEKHFGVGKNYKNFVVLEVGEGIGAGIIIDNQLYKGSSFSAGEVGFMVSDLKGLNKTYLLKGFMEKAASPNVLKKEMIKAIESGAKSQVTKMVENDLSRVTPAMICEAYLLGDELSIKIIKNVVENLSIIVINIALLINPEIIVVGGDIIEMPQVHKIFIEPINKLIRNVIPFRLPVIETASLGVDAGVSGCSIFAINNILNSLYPYIM